jgi:chromate transport protein ChrA
MMRQEVVQRRRWLTDEQFLDLLGATNLIPGPNSTEMAIHLGYERAGWRGLILGGACFIIPAMCIVLALAWLYREYGTTPQATWLLYGIKPVIIAVVAQALWGLRLAAAKSWPLAALGAAVVALYLVGGNEIALLLGSGLLALIAQNAWRLWRNATGAGAFVMLGPTIVGLAPVQVTASSFSLVTLFLTFLKIGSVLYGSGYVLLAFLRNDFVVRLGWLLPPRIHLRSDCEPADPPAPALALDICLPRRRQCRGVRAHGGGHLGTGPGRYHRHTDHCAGLCRRHSPGSLQDEFGVADHRRRPGRRPPAPCRHINLIPPENPALTPSPDWPGRHTDRYGHHGALRRLRSQSRELCKTK